MRIKMRIGSSRSGDVARKEHNHEAVYQHFNSSRGHSLQLYLRRIHQCEGCEFLYLLILADPMGQ